MIIMILLFIGCAVLTGCYWVSLIEGNQWMTSGRSFVIPVIFCENSVHVSVWVIDAEEAQVKFVSQQSTTTITLPGNTLHSKKLSCDDMASFENITSAYSMTSSRDVVVYIEYSYGCVMLRPILILGRNFFVPSLPNSVTPRVKQNFITITSISDNTNIIVTFPNKKTPPNLSPFAKSTKGEFYTLKLNKFQTAFVSSADPFAGVKIEGDANLVVLTGKMQSPGNSMKDVLLIDEVPAAENYGKEYFVYAPNWLNSDAIVYVSGIGASANFTLQTSKDKFKSSVLPSGSISFALPKGDYAFIRSFETNVAVSRAEPSQKDLNVTIVSMVPPLMHYTNLVDLKLPTKEPNDRYLLITNSQVNCNQSNPISNITGLRFHQDLTDISSRIFSLYETSEKALLENMVNATKISGHSPSVRGFVYRKNRGVYPFPMYSFPVAICRDVTPTPTSGSTPTTSTQVPFWLPKYLTGNDLDDDCDGRSDEELLNGQDDDGDGLVDEDVVFGCVNPDPTTVSSNLPSKIGVTDSNVHPYNSYYHVSIVALVVSLALALWAVAMLLGGSLLWEYHRRECSRRSTSVSPIFED